MESPPASSGGRDFLRSGVYLDLAAESDSSWRMSTQPNDPLFPPGCTHIEVKCWSCGHAVEFRPDQLPDGMERHDFESRAKCKCGVGWPHVTQLPKVRRSW